MQLTGMATVVAVLFLPAFALLYRANARRNARRLWREGRNVGEIGARRVIIGTDGFREVSDAGETMRHWHVVERVAVSPRHLFVYVSALGAFIVPRGAFSSDERFRQFVAVIRSHAHSATYSEP